MSIRTREEIIDQIARLLRDSNRITVMTGAGASRESGIPTFRDALEGYWSKFNPGDLATPQAFAKDPELVTRWYDERRCGVLECEPNAGHYALAQIEDACIDRGKAFSLITQNVDSLHQRAGSKTVYEVHGNIARWRCTETGETYTDLPVPFPEYPPPSPNGGLLRPDVVWFGEQLPADALEASARAAETSDLYIVIGTSGAVWPAAGFVLDAKRNSAVTVEINPSESEMSSHFNTCLREASGSALPEIFARAFGEKAP
jgi:NAD-dependent deacetylase